MNVFPSENEVARYKKQYPAGTRIELDFMDDPRSVPSGTKGTVKLVDDAANIHTLWDNGRQLAVIPGVDSFHIIND